MDKKTRSCILRTPVGNVYHCLNRIITYVELPFSVARHHTVRIIRGHLLVDILHVIDNLCDGGFQPGGKTLKFCLYFVYGISSLQDKHGFLSINQTAFREATSIGDRITQHQLLGTCQGPPAFSSFVLPGQSSESCPQRMQL